MFVLIIFGNIIECSSIDGSLIGCECNIVHACDSQGKPHNNWAEYLPKGVEHFVYKVQSMINLAHVCEDGVVTILFDHNGEIPL